MSPIRVLIVDDHKLVLEGTKASLAKHLQLEVVGVASTGGQALALIEQLVPDVVLLDVRLPDMSGIEVARRVHQSQPKVRLIAVSGYDDNLYIRGLRSVGVKACLPKTVTTSELARVICDVAAGRYQPETAFSEAGGLIEPLTPREFEVLERMGQGARNSEIAEALELSIKAVEFHITHILEKLQARSRAEAIVKGAHILGRQRPTS